MNDSSERRGKTASNRLAVFNDDPIITRSSRENLDLALETPSSSSLSNQRSDDDDDSESLDLMDQSDTLIDFDDESEEEEVEDKPPKKNEGDKREGGNSDDDEKEEKEEESRSGNGGDDDDKGTCINPNCIYRNRSYKLYYCSKCNDPYHINCCFLRRCKKVNPAFQPADDWVCYVCRTCALCKKGTFNEKDFVHCTVCDQVYHMQCQSLDKEKFPRGCRDPKFLKYKCLECSPSTKRGSRSSEQPVRHQKKKRRKRISDSPPPPPPPPATAASSSSSPSVATAAESESESSLESNGAQHDDSGITACVSSMILNGHNLKVVFKDGRHLFGNLQVMKSRGGSSEKFADTILAAIAQPENGVYELSVDAEMSYEAMYDALFFLHTGQLSQECQSNQHRMTKLAGLVRLLN